MNGMINVVRCLLERGADVHAKTFDEKREELYRRKQFYNTTALEHAARSGRLDIVQLLFDFGARDLHTL